MNAHAFVLQTLVERTSPRTSDTTVLTDRDPMQTNVQYSVHTLLKALTESGVRNTFHRTFAHVYPQSNGDIPCRRTDILMAVR